MFNHKLTQAEFPMQTLRKKTSPCKCEFDCKIFIHVWYDMSPWRTSRISSSQLHARRAWVHEGFRFFLCIYLFLCVLVHVVSILWLFCVVKGCVESNPLSNTCAEWLNNRFICIKSCSYFTSESINSQYFSTAPRFNPNTFYIIF